MTKSVKISYRYRDKNLIKHAQYLSPLFFQVQEKNTLPFRSYREVKKWVEEVLAHRNSSILIAKSGKKLVGGVLACEASFFGLSDTAVLIYDFGVLREYRRLGIAYECMQMLEKESIYKKIYACAVPKSGSHKLLNKLNYGQCSHSCNEEFLIMEKEL